MACTLIGGIAADCRDSLGGIKQVKVKIWPGISTIATDFTITSGDVAIASGSRSTWYTYFIESNTAMFTSNPTTNRQNGTLFYDEQLKIIFNKFSAKLRNEIHVLAQNRLLFAVKDQNDTHWLMGVDEGMMMEPSTSTSGTAKGDRSGSELTFKAEEKQAMVTMTQAVYDTLVT